MKAAQTETRSHETKEIIADEGETRLIQIRKSAGVQRDNDEIIRGCWQCNPYLLVTCVLCDSAGHVMGGNSSLRKETCLKCMEEAPHMGQRHVHSEVNMLVSVRNSCFMVVKAVRKAITRSTCQHCSINANP